MRLIDADRLKQEFRKREDAKGFLHGDPEAIIDLAPTVDPYQEDHVMGYRIHDLIILAERMRKEKVDPETLKDATENFMAGYDTAHREINAAIQREFEKTIHAMMEGQEPEENADA